MNLFLKYYPNKVEDFIGNKNAMNELEQFFKQFISNNEKSEKSNSEKSKSEKSKSEKSEKNEYIIPSIILRGPNGCGKTTAINLLADKYQIKVIDIYKNFFLNGELIHKLETNKKKNDCTKTQISDYYKDLAFYRTKNKRQLKLVIFEDFIKYKSQNNRTIIKTLIDLNKKYKSLLIVFIFDYGDQTFHKYKKSITNVITFIQPNENNFKNFFDKFFKLEKIEFNDDIITKLINYSDKNVRKLFTYLEDIINIYNEKNIEKNIKNNKDSDCDKKNKKIYNNDGKEEKEEQEENEENEQDYITNHINNISCETVVESYKMLDRCFNNYLGLGKLKQCYINNPSIVQRIEKNYLFHVKSINKHNDNREKIKLLCSISSALAKGDTIINKSINQTSSFQSSKLLYSIAFPTFIINRNFIQICKKLGSSFKKPRINYINPEYVSKYHEINNTTKKIMDKYIEIASVEGFIWISYILYLLVKKSDFNNVKHFCKSFNIKLDDISIFLKVDKGDKIEKNITKSLLTFLKKEKKNEKTNDDDSE